VLFRRWPLFQEAWHTGRSPRALSWRAWRRGTGCVCGYLCLSSPAAQLTFACDACVRSLWIRVCWRRGPAAAPWAPCTLHAPSRLLREDISKFLGYICELEFSSCCQLLRCMFREHVEHIGGAGPISSFRGLAPWAKSLCWYHVGTTEAGPLDAEALRTFDYLRSLAIIIRKPFQFQPRSPRTFNHLEELMLGMDRKVRQSDSRLSSRRSMRPSSRSWRCGASTVRRDLCWHGPRS
jgi:hypothetical protein